MSLIGEHALARLIETGRSAMTPLSDQSEDIVLQAVWEVSKPSRVFWLMNALAALIACYGLLADSTAVVIGAMVVAMLLGPISGVALGLNGSDRALLWTALCSLTGGIVWILGISVVVGLIHHDVPLTDEIISRTDPRLFDLMIALAGGGAGAVAVVSPRVSTAIVGVAVATALVPPLAAAGILLAREQFTLAGGALLLTLTNVIAIELAFSTIFWLSGYRRLTAIGQQGPLIFLRRNLLSLMLVGGLAVVFGVHLDRVIAKSLFESKVAATVRQHLGPTLGFHVVDIHLAREADVTIVRAVIRGPTVLSAETIAKVQSDLPSLPDGSKPALRVRFIQVVIMTSQGPVVSDDDAAGDN